MMRIGSAGPVLAVILAACGAQAASTPHGEASDAHGAAAAHGAPAHGDAHAQPAAAHGASASPAAHGDAAHWSYNDQAAWGHNADACSAGVEQSPVNLSSAAPVAEVPDLNPRYLPLEGAFVNNGHTLQFAPAANTSMLTIGADAYNLVQFHFHSPAEHTLDRRAYPVELHFVHRNSAGQLAVVGVFIEEGAENPALAALLAAKPQAEGDANASHVTLDPAALLPGDRTYFAYAGSLTTPPCSQGVRWNVLRTPIQASPEQVAALREALGASSRHVQALNQRTVLLGL
jgi:carbonic anhydrase